MESNGVAEVTSALAEHYGFEGMSKTTELWFNAAVVAGMIVYTHGNAYNERITAERRAKHAVANAG